VLIRRAWIGAPPEVETARQLDTYRSYAGDSATAHWGTNEMATSTDPSEVADRLIAAATAAGADALNVRVHVPGVAPSAVRRQIERIGTEIVSAVGRALTVR
jgi:hypothetical protein